MMRFGQKVGCLLGCLLAGASSMVVAAEANKETVAAKTAIAKPAENKNVASNIVEVKKIAMHEFRVVDATIEAVHQATVSSQTQGRITEITVDVDDYVSKGTVIIKLRDKEQRAAFDAANANHEEAAAEFKRVQEVYAKKLVAKSQLDKARARVKAARAKLDQAKESLDNTQIRAPYSGIVVKRHVEIGETARPGQKMMTGLSLEKLRAIVNLPQSLIHKVRQYKKTWVWVGKDLKQRIQAESLTISPYADQESHTFLVRINLPDGEHHVYPGMHTKVAFITGERQSLVVPEKAIARRSEVTGVYVKQNNKISFRYIRVGSTLEGGQREILSGVSEGEQILLDPVAAVIAIKAQNKTE